MSSVFFSQHAAGGGYAQYVREASESGALPCGVRRIRSRARATALWHLLFYAGRRWLL